MLAVAALLLVAAAAAGWGLVRSTHPSAPQSAKTVTAKPVGRASAHSSGGQSSAAEPAQGGYQLEVASTPAAQQQGLSGRDQIAGDKGMLFTYPKLDDHCMWMKDMKFDIDIIWLNAEKRIVSIVPDAKPSSYPQTYCAKSKYVIELQAGQTTARGLRVGGTMEF